LKVCGLYQKSKRNRGKGNQITLFKLLPDTEVDAKLEGFFEQT
jgi:hypothetical protein